MAIPSARSEIIDGLKAALPVLVSAGPFGVLFGAIAVQNGFTAGEAVAMSATVYAGASQMVGLEMFGNHIAPWLIVLSIFAVNFRHVLYSAATGRLIRHWTFWQKTAGFFMLVDPQFAESERRHERGLPVSFRWYMAMALPIYVFWVIEAWIGASFGNLIGDPKTFGLDFVLPVYFIVLVLGFRKRAGFLPVVLASSAGSIAAWFTVGSPWHVTFGALAGIALAACLPVNGKAVRP